MQIEESAFDLGDEDEKMNGEDEMQTKAEEVLNTRAEMLAERESLTAKFRALNIDTTAVKYYFKQLRNISGQESSFLESQLLMVEILINELEQDEDDAMKELMCCRGLLMLSLNERIAHDAGQEIANKILGTFNKLMQRLEMHKKRDIAWLS